MLKVTYVLLDVYAWVKVPWCVRESEDSFVEPVLLHLCVDQTQAARLAKGQVSLPAVPSMALLFKIL